MKLPICLTPNKPLARYHRNMAGQHPNDHQYRGAQPKRGHLLIGAALIAAVIGILAFADF